MYACVCVTSVCVRYVQDTTCVHKTLLGIDCSLQQDLPHLAAAAEEPTSKLTGSESVYKREGQMPWERVCDQCWLFNRHYEVYV